eukprot:1195222-Alexandrium_andersonii.AAC.1
MQLICQNMPRSSGQPLSNKQNHHGRIIRKHHGSGAAGLRRLDIAGHAVLHLRLLNKILNSPMDKQSNA